MIDVPQSICFDNNLYIITIVNNNNIAIKNTKNAEAKKLFEM